MVYQAGIFPYYYYWGALDWREDERLGADSSGKTGCSPFFRVLEPVGMEQGSGMYFVVRLQVTFLCIVRNQVIKGSFQL